MPNDQLELAARTKEANEKILSNLSFQAEPLCNQKRKSLEVKRQYRIERIGADKCSPPLDRWVESTP